MAYECALCPESGPWDDRYDAAICSMHAEMLARGRKVAAAQDRARPSVWEEQQRLQDRYEREAWKRLAERGHTAAQFRTGAKVAAEKALLATIEENRSLYRCVLCRGPLTGVTGLHYCQKKACKASIRHPRWASEQHPIHGEYAAVASERRSA